MGKTGSGMQHAYGILDRMKGGLKTRGFTIIETLVVLGISAALFVAVAATMANRQNGTEFSQSIQEIKSQIQQSISDVGAGVYDNTDNFSCSAGAFGPNIVTNSGTQGSNTGCVFLGKVMQFKADTNTNPEKIRIYPLAGLQRDSSGAEVTTYAAAKPTVISPATTAPSVPDATKTINLQYGLTVKDITYGSPASNVGAIAFVNSLASYSSGSIVSGSQQVNVIPVDTSTLGASQTAMATVINAKLATSTVNPTTGVKLCFVSGGTNQSGLITIGSNGRQLAVTLAVKENKTCS